MTNDQPRTDATSRERSLDHQYTLSVDQTADLYAKAGHPRTIRAIQKYCALSKLDCHKVETETGEKYLVAPYSVAHHIAYINEVRTVAINRDQARTDASVRPLESKDELSNTPQANKHEQPRLDADVRRPDDRYVSQLVKRLEEKDGEIKFLRSEVAIKNEQIKDLTEREREHNLLSAGMQKMLSPLLGPSAQKSE